jgi:hypothetical protein
MRTPVRAFAALLAVAWAAAAGAPAPVAPFPPDPSLAFGGLMHTPTSFAPTLPPLLSMAALRDAVMGKMQWSAWPGGTAWVPPTEQSAHALEASGKVGKKSRRAHPKPVRAQPPAPAFIAPAWAGQWRQPPLPQFM